MLKEKLGIMAALRGKRKHFLLKRMLTNGEELGILWEVKGKVGNCCYNMHILKIIIKLTVNLLQLTRCRLLIFWALVFTFS